MNFNAVMKKSAGINIHRFWFYWAALLCIMAASAPASAQQRTVLDELKAFPPASAGQVRKVILLPPQTDENAFRVGIVIGRTMMVDCNRTIFGAQFETRTVDGWGYDYHVVTSVGQPATTRMACPTTAMTRQFVRSADEPLLRYNSRLPLVIYAPSDVEVRYRIWRAGEESTAEQR